ncbi:MAG: flagellar biosynthesis protein FlhF [Burkholderiales bacterium RIFCSPHIGHO2_12_FULL_61_11]|nr:MAG: flagellar biosynthesis protein FlhF [Burkholderiales bacterium RIFCSPHIGHO2_12_FULL_61_11]
MQVNTARCKVVAPSGREALRLVRESLGPDAIVLSNRVTADGVEIVATLAAALEETPALATPAGVARAWLVKPTASIKPPIGLATVHGSVGDGDGDGDGAGAGAGAGHGDGVFRNIHSMRGLIDDQLADIAWNEAQKRDPLRGHLLRILLGVGFSACLAKELLSNLPIGQTLTKGVNHVKSALQRQLPMLEDEDALMDEGGVYALMGPTGVGKTTTTAKLAARCVMRFGAEKLALVTTDSYRIGAYEQLRIYGQILGVAVHAVKDAADLERVLADLRDKHMVLIDTVGRSQRDRAVSDQIAMLCGASRPVKRLLLLNASSHGDTLNEVVQAYRQSGQAGSGTDLSGCIFTKVDEATHPGVLIDMAIRHQLPVHYVSNGQKVPEDLMLGDHCTLIDSVFQTKNRRSLFVAGEPDPDERMVALRCEADVAAAQGVSERLRSQCQQLIRALAHNVQELTSTTRALVAGEVGFNETRSLWRQLSDDRMGAEDIARTLLSQACADSRVSCRDYVLSIASERSMAPDTRADFRVLVGSLLLSDRTGVPFASLNPLLASPAQPAMRQFDWEQSPQFAKPLVHLLADIPASGLIHEWQSIGLQWAAFGSAALRIGIAGSGAPGTLGKLAAGLSFSAPKPLLYRNKAAWSSVAQTLVSLRPDAKNGTADAAVAPSMLRCVVRRIVDAASGKPIAHSYVLASLGIQATAQQIALWPAWRAAAEPYFKLLNQGLGQLGEAAAPDDTALLKRLLIAGQISSTVFRLQRSQDAWAEMARKVLVQLTGRVVRPDRPVPGPVLFEGLEKLFVLLNALETDGAAVAPQFDMTLAQA